MRATGADIIPAAMPGEKDCCEKTHEIKVRLGTCRHLKASSPDSHSCSLYGTSDFPEMCAEYNCAGWAKAANKYDETNAILMTAQDQLNAIRGVTKL